MKWPDLDLFPQILSLHSLSRIRWHSVVGPVTTSQSWWGSTWQRLSELTPKLLLVIPGVQACRECQEGQGVYCGRCVQRMFAFPAGPATPSRDIGEKGHSGPRVGATIKRRQACFSKLWATDTRVYSQSFEKWWHGRFLGVFEIPLDFPLQRTTQDSIPQMSLQPSTCHISNLGPPTATTHKVSHWNLCGVQKNILQTKRKARRLRLLPFSLFLTVQPRPTACEIFHWAEKSSSCMVSKSGAINDSWCCQESSMSIESWFSYFGWKEEDGENSL